MARLRHLVAADAEDAAHLVLVAEPAVAVDHRRKATVRRTMRRLRLRQARALVDVAAPCRPLTVLATARFNPAS